jgi:hypothetical protein
VRQGFGPYADPEGPYVTRSGHVVTDEELDQWVAEAERGYDLDLLRSRRVQIGRMREDVVESETSPGTYYNLKLHGDGTWSCDCPGYVYRQECKHSRRKQEERPL